MPEWWAQRPIDPAWKLGNSTALSQEACLPGRSQGQPHMSRTNAKSRWRAHKRPATFEPTCDGSFSPPSECIVSVFQSSIACKRALPTTVCRPLEGAVIHKSRASRCEPAKGTVSRSRHQIWSGQYLDRAVCSVKNLRIERSLLIRVLGPPE